MFSLGRWLAVEGSRIPESAAESGQLRRWADRPQDNPRLVGWRDPDYSIAASTASSGRVAKVVA
jgi:hypothetical protein